MDDSSAGLSWCRLPGRTWTACPLLRNRWCRLATSTTRVLASLRAAPAFLSEMHKSLVLVTTEHPADALMHLTRGLGQERELRGELEPIELRQWGCLGSSRLLKPKANPSRQPDQRS